MIVNSLYRTSMVPVSQLCNQFLKSHICGATTPKIAPYSVRQLVPLYMSQYQPISALILLAAMVSVAYFWLRESLIEY